MILNELLNQMIIYFIMNQLFYLNTISQKFILPNDECKIIIILINNINNTLLLYYSCFLS